MFRKLRRSKDKKPEWSKQDDKVLQAVRDGDTEKLQHALTKKGTSPSKVNKEGQTALHVAASCGQLQSLEILLALGANIHIRDNNGMTALHHASTWGNLNVANRLLQAGTSLDVKDNGGQTALHHAAVGGHVDCTVLLVQAKASKDIPDENLKTPLLHAAQLGHTEVCKELVDRGSAVNAVDSQMKTPLILACENGHKEVVDLLVKRGAKVDAQDANGHDAAFYAEDHPDIAKSLESAPPVATWDIKSAEEEESNRVKPDAVDYVDAFNSSGDEEAGGHRGSPREETAMPSRAISMPTLTANNENENEKVLHELEEENEMLNDEVQELQVTNRRYSEKIKKLEAQLAANDIETLRAQLEEEKEKNSKAAQEIKTLKEMSSKTLDSDNENEPASWGDTDDDDLFDLPGLGSTKVIFSKPSSNKSDEMTRLRNENKDLRNKLQAGGGSSRVAELQKQVDELQSRLSTGGNDAKLKEEKELSSLQATTNQLREKVSSLNKKLAEVTAENEELKKQGRLPTFEPSPSSPRFHRLLQEKAHLEKQMKVYQTLSEDQKRQLDKLQTQMARTNSFLDGSGGISTSDQEDLLDRLEELTKENTRLQTLVGKQSKAIAQQTDRSRKDKQKYSELLAENEGLRKQLQGSVQGEREVGSSEAELVQKCEDMNKTIKEQERLLGTQAEERMQLNKLKAENVRLERLLCDQKESLREDGGGDHLGRTVPAQISAEMEEVKAENARLRSQLSAKEKDPPECLPGSDEKFAQLSVTNEALEARIKSLSEEVDFLKTAQDNYSKRKYTEVLLENRKLKESLQQQQSLPNGDVKHASKEGEAARAEAERLREKLVRMENKLEETVNVYRQHLLNAVQGNMDPAIKQALMQIIRLRTANGSNR